MIRRKARITEIDKDFRSILDNYSHEIDLFKSVETKNIVLKRLNDNKTFNEIGKECYPALSGERVRQIYKMAFNMARYRVKRYEYKTNVEANKPSNNVITTVIVLVRPEDKEPGYNKEIYRSERVIDLTSFDAFSDIEITIPGGILSLLNVPASGMPIEVLNLSNRVYRRLVVAGIEKIGEINSEQLLKTKGFGKKAFQEIRDKLKLFGLELK